MEMTAAEVAVVVAAAGGSRGTGVGVRCARTLVVAAAGVVEVEAAGIDWGTAGGPSWIGTEWIGTECVAAVVGFSNSAAAVTAACAFVAAAPSSISSNQPSLLRSHQRQGYFALCPWWLSMMLPNAASPERCRRTGITLPLIVTDVGMPGNVILSMACTTSLPHYLVKGCERLVCILLSELCLSCPASLAVALFLLVMLTRPPQPSLCQRPLGSTDNSRDIKAC